ncbi:hypothetical protein ACET3Z_029378 [Daucus carota]
MNLLFPESDAIDGVCPTLTKSSPAENKDNVEAIIDLPLAHWVPSRKLRKTRLKWSELLVLFLAYLWNGAHDAAAGVVAADGGGAVAHRGVLDIERLRGVVELMRPNSNGEDAEMKKRLIVHKCSNID